MRSFFICALLICFALAFAGCGSCGSAPFSASSAPAASAAPQASDAVSTGCRLKAGLECGGVSLGGFDLQFPDIFTAGGVVMRGLSGSASTQSECQPATRSTDPCSTPGACAVPEGR